MEKTPSVTMTRRRASAAATQLRLEVGHVGVAVAQPAGLAEPDAVDERGVVELVGDDRVLGAEQHLEDAAVGVEAGRVEDRRLGAEEVRQPRLELGVQGLRAADEAHAGHAEAPLVQRFCGGGDHGRVVGQAEVVVGAEVQRLRLAVVTWADCGEVELALVLVETGVADLLQRGAQVGLERSVHRGALSAGLSGCGQDAAAQDQSRTTLPHSPERAASNASCHFSAGKRWVMTELTAVRSRSLVCEHRAHGVPGVVHLAAVDALDGDHVRDDPAPVDRERVLGQTEHRDARAVVEVGEHVRHGLRAAAHLQADVEALRMPSWRWASATLVRETLIARSAPGLAGEVEAVVADVGDHDVAGTDVPGDRRRHDPDRSGTGDEDVLAGERES